MGEKFIFCPAWSKWFRLTPAIKQGDTVIKIMSIFALCLLAAAPAFCLPQAVRTELDNPAALGSGRFSFLFNDVYHISLYTPEQAFNPAGAFALKIDYLMPLKGAAIVGRTIELIKRQSFEDKAKLNQWKNTLVGFFPDVDKGVSLTGYKDKQGHTQFYRNEQWIGAVADPEFSHYFFAIWLAEHTSEPKLRRALLGMR